MSEPKTPGKAAYEAWCANGCDMVLRKTCDAVAAAAIAQHEATRDDLADALIAERDTLEKQRDEMRVERDALAARVLIYAAALDQIAHCGVACPCAEVARAALEKKL